MNTSDDKSHSYYQQIYETIYKLKSEIGLEMNLEKFQPDIPKKIFQYIEINSQKIAITYETHITQEDLNKLNQCHKYQEFIDKLPNTEEYLMITEVCIEEIFIFTKGNVGFVTLKIISHPVDQDKKTFTHHIFMRGHGVAVLVIVTSKNHKKLLVVEQFRVPVMQNTLEAPAGMIDEDGDFLSKASQEIYEETGVKISRQNLHSLGYFYSAPDICEEQIHLYYIQICLTEQKMMEMGQKLYGEGDLEKIRVRFINFSPEQILNTKDSMLIALTLAYSQHEHSHYKQYINNQ